MNNIKPKKSVWYIQTLITKFYSFWSCKASVWSLIFKLLLLRKNEKKFNTDVTLLKYQIWRTTDGQ